MFKQLFKRVCHFTGRNGTFKAGGLDVSVCNVLGTIDSKEPVIEIRPLTSKGEIGHCLIQIPLEEWDNLSNKIVHELMKFGIKHRFSPDQYGVCIHCTHTVHSPIHIQPTGGLNG